MMPRAAVRITLTEQHLDDFYGLSREATRGVHALLWDVPAEALVYIDLGPCRRADSLLIAQVALLPCAPRVVFESPRWRVAQEAAEGLQVLLSEVAAS